MDRIYDPSYGAMTQKTDWRPVEVKYEDENIVSLEIAPAYSGNWVFNPHSDQSDLSDPERRN